ncbi:MAG: family 43 glycosylhydrolase [Myxococcales bacterium]|nr:family 43 glycosylhydrolase [Myxococcales bacterium]MCB9704073.1 family 43 glycosylhydrolase [Myxococcales bacterium]
MRALPPLVHVHALLIAAACSPGAGTGSASEASSSSSTSTSGHVSSSTSGGAATATSGGEASGSMTTSTTTTATATSGGSSGGDETSGGPGVVLVDGQNPVIAGDAPDPGVLRVVGEGGAATYYLSHTVHNGGDFPLYTSSDLLQWAPAASGLLQRTSAPGSSIDVNGHHLCSRWAPEIAELGPGSYMLSFTAQRYASAQSPCPAYNEDSGVYLAWSSSPTGPFALAEKPWEPLPAGAQISNCPIRESLPRSLDVASKDCQGTYCHHIIRLDSTVFRDPASGRWWLAYAWYTNSPPKVQWEQEHFGELVNLVELDPADPFAVICDLGVPQIPVADPHDQATLARLGASCEGCDQMLSFTRGRQGEEMTRFGFSWGVVEAPSLFRRGDYVYLLLSGSAWDSAYYHVYWVAAPTVEGLSQDNPERLVGRFLIPSDGQAFGHGAPVLGPDGEHWYYVHHRLTHGPCKDSGVCARDVWVSPIDFIDRDDGLGAVHIAPRWPAKDPSFQVAVPAG